MMNNTNSTPEYDLTVIVVNYNGKHWLERLMPQIQTCVLQPGLLRCEVVVVDNGSSDASLAALEQWPWVRVIVSPTNRGFAAGNNLALQTCRSRYVLLLNTDTSFPDEGNLITLVEYMDQHPQVAVLTPRLMLSNGLLDRACHRGEPTPWASFTYLIGLERLFPRSRWFGAYHQGWKDRNTVHTIDACSGAAMMVRTAAMDKVGMLDERFFMYAEDLDWCRRFREAGFEVVFHPGATIIHHKYQSGMEGTSGETRKATRTWFYETMLQYYDKYHPSSRKSPFRLALKGFIYINSRQTTGR